MFWFEFSISEISNKFQVKVKLILDLRKFICVKMTQ